MPRQTPRDSSAGRQGRAARGVTTVYQHNDVKDTRELPGDRLYLISGSAVIDGRTLRTSRLAISSAESRGSAVNNPSRGTLLLSPRKSRTALFARGDQNRVAPVVADLGSGEVTQHLRIDRDQTYILVNWTTTLTPPGRPLL